MTTERRLAPTYETARRDVLAAATRAGAEVTSFPHPESGREGEELAIDVIEVGPDDAGSVVVIVSGTHGVEGYAGSALQHWWLDERSATMPEGVRVVIVHALNPVGFSWVRRVNEDNVDLNRNFVDWSKPPPTNDGYREIADLLVPADWSEGSQSRNDERADGGRRHRWPGALPGNGEQRTVRPSDRRLPRRVGAGLVASLGRRAHPRNRRKRDPVVSDRSAHRSRTVGSR